MIGPEEEKIPRRVEKEPFQGEALVRHEHGVHLAGDRMHELRVDAHIRAAPDRGREGVGIRAKDLDLRRGKGLRQGHLAHRAKLRPARAFFIRAMHGVHGDQHALGGRIAVMGRIFTDAARGRIRRGIALLGAKVHGADPLFQPVRIQPELFKKLHVPVGRHGVAPLGVGYA